MDAALIARLRADLSAADFTVDALTALRFTAIFCVEAFSNADNETKALLGQVLDSLGPW